MHGFYDIELLLWDVTLCQALARNRRRLLYEPFTNLQWDMNGNEKCIKIVRLQYVAQYVKGAVSQSSNPTLIIASNAFEKISGHSFFVVSLRLLSVKGNVLQYYCNNLVGCIAPILIHLHWVFPWFSETHIYTGNISREYSGPAAVLKVLAGVFSWNPNR